MAALMRLAAWQAKARSPMAALWPRVRMAPRAFPLARQASNTPGQPHHQGPKGGPIGWKGLAAIVAIGGAAVFYFEAERSRVEKIREKRKTQSAGRPALGGPFTLVDTAGKEVTEKDFLGRWQLLYFGFTFCPDICPEELEKMGEIVTAVEKKYGEDKITPIFISVDPDRDTPPKIEAYVKQFHPHMVGLTGTFDQIKAICRHFRVYYSRPEPDGTDDYLVDHSIIQYLLDPEGTFVAYYGQNTTSPEAISSIMEHIAEYDQSH